MTALVERVARGVAALDLVDPDWLYEVDLETLDMGDSNECVAGQQPGGFAETLVRLGLAHYDGDSRAFYRLDYEGVRAHGLMAGDSLWEGRHEEYLALTAEWRRVIIERRRADALAAAGK